MTAPAPGSARGIAAAVRDGDARARDIVADHLARIARRDREVCAFLETFDERALTAADAIDRRRAAGHDPGPLAGVPVAIKDNILCAGQTAASGSRMLERFVAPYTATVVERLERLGAIVLGRTNMDEFGMGSSCEHSAFGPTRNPWDHARVPGGSSGGAAAAVAADLCPLSLGSDTGGSVRQPAALCGVTGLKPTYGRLSRRGLTAFASSLDCIGLLARTSDDIALAMQIAGHDPGDSTSSASAVPDYLPAAGADLRSLTIGVLPDLESIGVAPEVATAVRAALDTLRTLGARTVEVEIPALRHAIPTYYLLAAAEASSNLARFDGVRFGLDERSPTQGRAGERSSLDATYAHNRSRGFGPEVQLRVLLGTFALQHGYQDEMYGQATRVRELVRQDLLAALQRCDVLAWPTSPVVAFGLGARLDDPVAMYACDLLTVPANLAGLPALSLPCGFARPADEPAAPDLPVGLQLIGRAFDEAQLLRTGHAFQQQTDWHRRTPPGGAA